MVVSLYLLVLEWVGTLLLVLRVLKEKLTVQGVGVVERDVVHVLDEDIEKRCGKVI